MYVHRSSTRVSRWWALVNKLVRVVLLQIYSAKAITGGEICLNNVNENEMVVCDINFT